jgi:UDP-2,3-diacylglucosamine pyrophosphatase LpxH
MVCFMQRLDEHRRYRTIWISDVHLGTKACRADELLDFLRHTDSDTLYLVGDIIDGWRLKRAWHWPQAHNDVVQKVLRKARKGTRVVYIPGNHDEGARSFVGHVFGTIEVAEDAVHTTADGRSLLVIHGDAFDVVVRHARWLAHAGDLAYRALLAFNTVIAAVRRHLGYPYWSFSAFMKHRTKKAVEFLGRFELALAEEARRRGVDGVVCGHVHTAEMKEMRGLSYFNDGDWVESCTALVEHETGEIELIRWSERALVAAQPRAHGVAA